MQTAPPIQVHCWTTCCSMRPACHRCIQPVICRAFTNSSQAAALQSLQVQPLLDCPPVPQQHDNDPQRTQVAMITALAHRWLCRHAHPQSHMLLWSRRPDSHTLSYDSSSQQPAVATEAPSFHGLQASSAHSAASQRAYATSTASCRERGSPAADAHTSSSHGTPASGASSSTSTYSSFPSSSSSSSPSSSLERLLDLRFPATWYPLARQMRRKIVAHLGPTNSGKTHSALEALRAARTGMYCGPLRLLALEVSERLREGGLPCRLVTGQEVGGEDDAAHVACTVEMASLSQPVEVAVLDEIQMISDPGRGWGWTRALLGLPARTLHVCGAPESLALLRTLAKECGDELQVQTYHRLSPLVVMNKALGSVAELQEGDCMVAFSRRAVHGLKREVLRRTPHQCAVVYGALPPSTRRRQAALFNGVSDSTSEPSDTSRDGSGDARSTPPSPSPSPSDAIDLSAAQFSTTSGSTGSISVGGSQLGGAPGRPPSPTDGDTDASCGTAPVGRVVFGGPRGVLVASDAIGMGLNLNIRRVVFSSMYKFDGTQVRRLSAQEVKQIAGRAGRFRSAHAAGHVTCLHEEDLHVLHEALATRSAPLEAAALMPRPEDIAAFVARHPGLRYDSALEQYARVARLSPHYRLGTLENILALATMLQTVSHYFSPEELYVFCVSPADSKDPAVSAALLRFASAFAREGRVPADLALPPYPLSLPETEANLKSLEALHRVCDLYIWLSYRFPEQFPDQDLVEQARTECSAFIALGLDQLATYYRRRGKHFQDADATAGAADAQEAQPAPGTDETDHDSLYEGASAQTAGAATGQARRLWKRQGADGSDEEEHDSWGHKGHKEAAQVPLGQGKRYGHGRDEHSSGRQHHHQRKRSKWRGSEDI